MSSFTPPSSSHQIHRRFFLSSACHRVRPSRLVGAAPSFVHWACLSPSAPFRSACSRSPYIRPLVAHASVLLRPQQSARREGRRARDRSRASAARRLLSSSLLVSSPWLPLPSAARGLCWTNFLRRITAAMSFLCSFSLHRLFFFIAAIAAACLCFSCVYQSLLLALVSICLSCICININPSPHTLVQFIKVMHVHQFHCQIAATIFFLFCG